MMNKNGFTMIEVITVLVLIGIISAVGVSILPKVGESEFAERMLLKSNLRFARQRSMETTNNWSVSFSGNSYSLVGDGITVFPSTGMATHVSEASFTASGTIEFATPHGTLVGNQKMVTFENGSTVTVYPTGAIQ